LFAGISGCKEDSTDATTDPAADGTTTETTNETTDNGIPATTTGETESTPALPATTASWTEEKHDFGKIKEGEVVGHTFAFKNTGNEPLKIENVKASCGCTTPDWTREEVAPGAEGFIKVEFNSKGKSGIQNKTVTVMLNTEERTKLLSFTGEVIKEEGAE
jgi:hypothetical protein